MYTFKYPTNASISRQNPQCLQSPVLSQQSVSYKSPQFGKKFSFSHQSSIASTALTKNYKTSF